MANYQGLVESWTNALRCVETFHLAKTRLPCEKCTLRNETTMEFAQGLQGYAEQLLTRNTAFFHTIVTND